MSKFPKTKRKMASRPFPKTKSKLGSRKLATGTAKIPTRKSSKAKKVKSVPTSQEEFLGEHVSQPRLFALTSKIGSLKTASELAVRSN